MESHADTIKPRDVTSDTMVMPMTIPCRTSESHVNMSKPRNVASTITATAQCVITATPRNVTHTIMVMTTHKINFMSASPNVKVTDDLKIEAVNSPLTDQTPPESPTYKVAPVKQQDTLHNFSHYVNQGTFGIPCGGKIYRPSPGMDPVVWPQEKSTHLPRTLAQLAHQDFKKEPPDNFVIILNPQYPIIPHFL